MAQMVKVYVKKQLRLDMLTFRQRDMYEIGNAGLDAVKARLAAAKGPNDAPAKPLRVSYARQKSKRHLGNRRNLKFTGRMLDNLKIRTVSEKAAKAGLTSRKERIKGQANTRIEPWCLFSPANRKVVFAKAEIMFKQATKRMLIARARWGVEA